MMFFWIRANIRNTAARKRKLNRSVMERSNITRTAFNFLILELDKPGKIKMQACFKNPLTASTCSTMSSSELKCRDTGQQRHMDILCYNLQMGAFPKFTWQRKPNDPSHPYSMILKTSPALAYLATRKMYLDFYKDKLYNCEVLYMTKKMFLKCAATSSSSLDCLECQDPRLQWEKISVRPWDRNKCP